jgi:sulfonate transport system permease protein
VSEAVVAIEAAPAVQGASWWRRSTATRRGLVVPALVLGVWIITTHYGLVNKHLVAKPEKVVERAIKEISEGTLFVNLLASVQRDLFGFVLGAVSGIGFGGLLGVSRLSARLLGPTFHAAKQVAMFAWIPLMSVWLGTGEEAKVVFIAIAAFYPIVVNTQEGIETVAREHIEVARAFDYTRWQIVTKVVFPSALPSIFAGVHTGLIYAWLGTIGAEYLLSPGFGIGNLMIEGRESLQMDKVLLGVIVVGLVGASINQLASRLEKYVLRWRVTAFEARQ